MAQLEERIADYYRQSRRNARVYKSIKFIEILAAAFIPFLLGFDSSRFRVAAAILGIVVIASEILVHLNPSLRDSFVRMPHLELLEWEKNQYANRTGPYARAINPPELLVERTGFLVPYPYIVISKSDEPEKRAIESESKSGDIRIRVHTPGGEDKSIEAPSDLGIEEFIRELVSALNLPSKDAEGRSTAWTLDNMDTGRELAKGLTLAQAGVLNGHRLFLRRQVIAGGDGLMTITVLTAGGAHRRVMLPDMSTGSFIQDVPELPLHEDASFDRSDYQITDSQGRELDPKASLEDNGIRDGDTVYLHRLTRAGGSPAKESRVRFSVYCPRSVAFKNWFTLLAFAHIPEATQEIQAEATKSLGNSADDYQQFRQSAVRVIHQEAEITVIPELPGCRVNPPQASFKWIENWHKAEFRFQPIVEQGGAGEFTINGSVSFYVGPILVGEVKVPLHFGDSQFQKFDDEPTRITVPGYEAIFVSYSHKDTVIVEELEKAYTVLGMQYLRDVKALRSGEKWNDALLKLIGKADIFQLCWSHSAKESEYVTKEWQHALAQDKPSFIRPCYWENPMPPPPPELAEIHFARLEWDGRRLCASPDSSEARPADNFGNFPR